MELATGEVIEIIYFLGVLTELRFEATAIESPGRVRMERSVRTTENPMSVMRRTEMRHSNVHRV